MLLSGFTFVRNVVRFDYPAVESIRSILPIVDEFIVVVGPDDDGTLDLIRSIDDPKIKIIRSQWNPNVSTGGYVYAQQTNIALFNCMGKWAFYLQADEVVHEDDLPKIMEGVHRHADDDRVEALALDELTFWGDYKTIFKVHPWRFSKRCWVVKPHRFVLSRGDAAGFCVHPKYKERGRKIRAVQTDARVFHYSSVKSEKALTEKYRTVSKYWSETHSEEQIQTMEADYYNLYPREFVEAYTGTHPGVMTERIRNHTVSMDLTPARWPKRPNFADRKKLINTELIKIFGNRFFDRGSYSLLNLPATAST